MTGVKILEAVETYEQLFAERGMQRVKVSHDMVPQNAGEQLGHAYAMLPQLREFVAEGRLEKAFRWLGFIQGVLWANGVFVLEDLKNHNRPVS